MISKIIKPDNDQQYSFLGQNEREDIKIIFHTFSTDNFLKWAFISLNSIDLSYGNETEKIFQTLNISDAQKVILKKYTNNCHIYDLQLSDEEIFRQIDIPKRLINKFKDDLKHGLTTDDNYKLKLFISVNLRYLSLRNIFSQLKKNTNFNFFIHSDVDINHRSNLVEKIKNVDFDLALFGRNFQKTSNLPLGAYLIFKNTENSEKFLENWMKNINLSSFKKWPRGYGQISLKNTLMTSVKNDEIKLLDLSYTNNISFSKTSDKNSDIWLNSNSKHEGSAFETPFKNSLNDISIRVQDLSNKIDSL